VAAAYAAEVRPLLEAPVHARASGYVRRWMVDIGGQVAAGQLLAEIDAPEVAQELARARAELAQAEAAVALAKATAERWADLLKSQAVSRQEAAERQADQQVKTAAAEASRANVRRLEELQGFTRVTAPFAGVVTARRVDVGELVTANGARELFRVAQTGRLRVFVRLPQTVAPGIAVGQEATLAVPEHPGRTFAARVVRTAGTLDATSRTLLVELEVDNAKGEILAGSFAQVRFTGTLAPATLTLPSNALLFRSEGQQVGVVGADGRVSLRTIRLGRDFGPTVEVLGGVGASDQVINNPPDSLVDGMLVRVMDGSR
jgi:membrane fusion protein (multidrug efflux system)